MGTSILWYEPVGPTTIQNAVSASANGTVLDLNGKYSAITLQTKGTFTATVHFEASNDGGTTWKAIQGLDINAGTVAASTTAATVILINVTGVYKFRARVAWTGGTSCTVIAVATSVPIAPLSSNVVQSTHDNLNANANMQVANTDVGAANPVPTSLTGSNAPLSGQKNVTTAGTQVALGGDQEYKSIVVIAKAGNTGNIYIGNSAVSSADGGILPAGGFVPLDFVNTSEVYIDSDVNGEGVSWIGVI